MRTSLVIFFAACALSGCQARYGFDVMNQSSAPVRILLSNRRTGIWEADGFLADLSPNARLRWRTGEPKPPREQYEIRVLTPGSEQVRAQCFFVPHIGSPTVYAVQEVGGAWRLEEVAGE